MPLNVCVYGSSSRNTPEAYKAAARTLGAALAQRSHLCINGAGAEGVMGALNEACKAAGGRVRGVCHKMFVDGPIMALFQGLELIQTEGDGLTERKRGLAEGADCFIALPVHAPPASVHVLSAPSLSRACVLRAGRARHVGRAVGGGVRAAAGRGSGRASVPCQYQRVRRREFGQVRSELAMRLV